MWVKMLRGIYNIDGGCSSLTPKNAYLGPWNSIIRALRILGNWDLDILGNWDLDLQSFCPICVGDRIIPSSWMDVWSGTSPLSLKFQRIFAFHMQRQASIWDRFLISLETGPLRREPRGGMEQSQWEELPAIL